MQKKRFLNCLADAKEEMVEIPHANFHGLEYLGSGRLYIWSRILPMLKHDILKGSGPVTFAEVFPQNDYAGKMIYAESTGRIMERASLQRCNVFE